MNDDSIYWSKSGAVLWRDDEDKLPLLLWGDTNIYKARGVDKDGYKYDTFGILISPRPDKFDSVLVESGP